VDANTGYDPSQYCFIGEHRLLLWKRKHTYVLSIRWKRFRQRWSSPPSVLYIDFEGVDLCRQGSISILTLLVDSGDCYLFDVHTLDALAFDTAGATTTKTLKAILQQEDARKVFFDVRNDSDALSAHYGVILNGVEDVQLLESATRKTTPARKYLSGLAKCIENNVVNWPHPLSLATWKSAKREGECLFKAEHGGSYEVFNQRPISRAVVVYCIGDVLCLPELYNRLYLVPGAPTDRRQDLIKTETKRRIASTYAPGYQPYRGARALAPWTAEQNRALDEWNYVPPPIDEFEALFDAYEEMGMQDQEEGFFDDYNEYHDFYDERDDYEDWTRADWQGPPF
jgi:exonuclease 3'-5' domain-containing protein 1